MRMVYKMAACASGIASMTQPENHEELPGTGHRTTRITSERPEPVFYWRGAIAGSRTTCPA